MSPLVIIAIAILYLLLYFISSFLFSYKVFLVLNGKYRLGALVSGIALFIAFSLYAFIPYLAVTLNSIWMTVALLVSLVFASFLSSVVMSKVDLFHTKNDDKNNEPSNKEQENNSNDENQQEESILSLGEEQK